LSPSDQPFARREAAPRPRPEAPWPRGLKPKRLRLSSEERGPAGGILASPQVLAGACWISPHTNSTGRTLREGGISPIRGSGCPACIGPLRGSSLTVGTRCATKTRGPCRSRSKTEAFGASRTPQLHGA
jgi:hypothetical protein